MITQSLKLSDAEKRVAVAEQLAEAEQKAYKEAKLAREYIQNASSQDFLLLDFKHLEEIRNHTSVPMQVPAGSVQVSKAEVA